MLYMIPDDKWKDFKVESLRIRGYKSMRNKTIKTKHGKQIVITEGSEIDLDGASISFKDGSFSFEVGGEENLKKLKELINFVLEIE